MRLTFFTGIIIHITYSVKMLIYALFFFWICPLLLILLCTIYLYSLFFKTKLIYRNLVHFFFIEAWLIYNVVFISSVQQMIQLYIYIFFLRLFYILVYHRISNIAPCLCLSLYIPNRNCLSILLLSIFPCIL